jgi:hypothetical protein
MSHTLTLEAPEEVFTVLVKTAEHTGQTPEALATQWLADAMRRSEEDPLEKFIGAFDSGGSDWADQHDKYLSQSL